MFMCLLSQIYATSLVEYSLWFNFGQVINDYSGNGWHAVYGTSYSDTVSDPVPTPRGAYFYTGNTITMPTNDFVPVGMRLFNPFTLVFWIFNPSSNSGMFFYRYGLSNSSEFIQCSIVNTNQVSVAIQQLSLSDSHTFQSLLNNTIWNLIVISFSGSNIKLNINTYDTETYSVSSFIQEDSTQTYGMNIMNPQLGINQAYIFSLVITDTQAVSTNYFNTQDINACVVRMCNQYCSFAAVTSLGNGCISTLTSPYQGSGGYNLTSSCAPSYGGDGAVCYNCSSSCSPKTCWFLNPNILCLNLTQTICSDGYYLLNNTCHKCNSTCYSCTNSSSCLICKDSHASPATLGCKCISGYYNTSTLTDNGSCLSCSSDCYFCTNSSTCSICKDSHALPGSLGCNCISGYYNTSTLTSGGSCLKCDSNCFSFADLNECKNNSFYWDGTACFPCESSCLSCDGPTNCLSNSKSLCENGYYSRSETCGGVTTDYCFICDSTCFTCSGPYRNQCSSCHQNATLQSNQTCICDKGFSWDSLCTRNKFSAFMSINSTNFITITFSEALVTSLNSTYFDIKVWNESQNFKILIIDNLTILIQILFVKDVEKNTGLEVFILHDVVSQENSLLSTLKLTAILYPETSEILAEQALKEQIASVQTATQQGAVVWGAVLASVSLLNLNFGYLFQFLNAAEIYLLIQNFNIDLDPVFLEFMSSLQSSFEVPSLFQYFVRSEAGASVPTKYQNIGYSTNLIMINSGSNITVIIGILGFLILLWMIKGIWWLLTKRTIEKINRFLVCRIVIRILIQTVFNLSINSIIGIYLTKLANKTQIIDFLLSVFVIVIHKQGMEICFLVIMLLLIKKRIRVNQEEKELFLSNFGTIFEEFEYSGLSSCYFYLIFVIRRYGLVASILFFKSPIFKLLISAVFSLFVIFIQVSFYVLVVHPFKDKINQFYILLNEFLTCIYFSYIGLQYLQIIEYDRKTQGTNCMIIITVALGLNCLFGLLGGFYNCYTKISIRKHHKIVPVQIPSDTNTWTSTKESEISPKTSKKILQLS